RPSLAFLKGEKPPKTHTHTFLFTCSCPMEGRPGEDPDAMDVTLICPVIWPMLLGAMLLPMETAFRLMVPPLYMLLLLCCPLGPRFYSWDYLLPPMLPCGQPFMSGEP
uniref:Uncharacterized protein n=1 Tax=Nothobranchius furzeri TaxID=105023 RepID=A0A8C6LMN4_NOTFU